MVDDELQSGRRWGHRSWAWGVLCGVVAVWSGCGRSEIALDVTVGVPIGITAAATPGVETGPAIEGAPTVNGWSTPVQATSAVRLRAPGGELLFEGGPSKAWMRTDRYVMVDSIEVMEGEARPFAAHRAWTDETLAALKAKGWSWNASTEEVAPHYVDEAHWARCGAAPDGLGAVEHIGSDTVGWPTLHWRRGAVLLEVGARFRCWRARGGGELMVSREFSFGVGGPYSF